MRTRGRQWLEKIGLARRRRAGEVPDALAIFRDFVALRHCEIAALAACVIAVLTGCLALAGWWLHKPALASMVTGLISMKPNAAAGFIFSGTALWLLRDPPGSRPRWRNTSGRILASLVTLLGATALVEYLLDWNFGFDQLLFRATLDAPGAIHPGLMAQATALCFLLLGPALLLLDWQTVRKRHPSQALGLLTALLGLIAFLGYIYNAKALYGVFAYSSMALPTAILMMLLGSGVLLARPANGLMAQVTSGDRGGVVARWLLPIIVILPTVLGWLRLRGQHAGFYGTEVAQAMLVGANIIVFALIVWTSALWLNRSDRDLARHRENLEQEVAARTAELARTQDELEERVEERTKELKERTRRLQESEQRYRFLSETMPQIIWTAKPDGNLDYYNQRWYDYTGMTLEQTRDWGWKPVLHPDDLQNCVERWTKSITTGCDYQVEYRFKRAADGAYRWHLGRAFPMRNEQGEIVQWIGTCTDIDDHKQAEELLREAHVNLEERVAERTTELAAAKGNLQAVLDAATHISIIATDPKGLITLFNSGAERMLGYRAEEMVGQQTATFLHLASEITQHGRNLHAPVGRTILGFDVLAELARRGISEEDEWTYVRKNGSHLTVSLGITALSDARGEITGFLGVARDITESKRAAEELLKAKEAAEAATLAKSKFLAVMSHEIRTPMNGVMGMTNLLLDTALDEQQNRFARTIHDSANSLLAIVNDILDFSKVESGKLTLEELDFNLRDAVEDTLEFMSERTHDKPIELMGFIDPEVPVYLRGDAGRLRQVLNNLIGNAVKFTAKGEIVVRVTMQAETETDAALRFDVSDTGIGISHEEQKRLFQAFAQADSSTTRRYGGTGLGLAISRQLVELMQGQLSMHSLVGKGSTFSFTIKLGKQSQAGLMEPKRGFDLAPSRVLIVDDNSTNCEILGQQLEGSRMRSSCAAEGLSALDMLSEATVSGDPFDVAILDLDMPGMNGLALARVIINRPAISRTKLILLTSLSGQLNVEMLKAAGFGAGLVKPVRQSRLLDCIATVMTGDDSGSFIPAKPSSAGVAVIRPPVRKIRILLAEDSPINQLVAISQLRKLGYAADPAANGLEVLAALQRIPYDVVLMDCMMPEMDGYEATARIRSLELEHPEALASRNPVYIIAMTANAMQGDREKCLAVGMDDYVSKPVELLSLRLALENWRPLDAGASKPAHESPSPSDNISSGT